MDPLAAFNALESLLQPLYNKLTSSGWSDVEKGKLVAAVNALASPDPAQPTLPTAPAPEPAPLAAPASAPAPKFPPQPSPEEGAGGAS